MISAHCHLCPRDSRNYLAPASRVAEITGMHHHAWLIFVFLVEMRFHHIGQAGLELLTSSDPPTSASQSAEITGVSHCVQPHSAFLYAWLHILVLNTKIPSSNFSQYFTPNTL
uniref:Uncharacterized protein n=1 Tax=Macaca mulatta TaxID=9544 RepID=A0A5F7ZGL2_MACMU